MNDLVAGRLALSVAAESPLRKGTLPVTLCMANWSVRTHYFARHANRSAYQANRRCRTRRWCSAILSSGVCPLLALSLATVGCTESDWQQLTVNQPVAIEWSTALDWRQFPETLYDLTGTVNGAQLWAVGQSTMWYSANSGQTWQARRLPSDSFGANHRSIYVTSSGNEIWLVDGSNSIRRSRDGGEDWESVDLPIDFGLDVHGDSSRFLWAVGASSQLAFAIAYSMDGGDNWLRTDLSRPTIQNEDELTILWDVYSSTDGSRVWAAERSGTILHTDDRGETWRWTSVEGVGELRGVYAASVDRVWAVGSTDGRQEGIIVSSTDGGLTWRTRKFGEIIDSSFLSIHGDPSGNRLVAIGPRTIVYSVDGGENWKRSDDGLREETLQGVFVAEDGAAWVVGDDNTVLRSTGDYARWERVQLYPESVAAQTIYSTADGASLWIVGERGIMKSTDQGKTWSTQRLPLIESSDHPHSFHLSQAGDRLWVIDEDVVSTYATDFTGLWGLEHTVSLGELLDPGERLMRVYGTIDSSHLWALSNAGRVFHSADEGDTWNSEYIEDARGLHGIHSVSDGSRVWIVGNNGVIYHSVDFGETWTRQESGTSVELHAVHSAVDGLRVWAVGVDGTIIHSVDGGVTWTMQESNTRTSLWEIDSAADGRRLWVIGASGSLVYTADGGLSWHLSSISDGDLSGIQVSADGSKLWAVGENGLFESLQVGNYPVPTAVRVDYDSPKGIRVQVELVDYADTPFADSEVVLLGANSFNFGRMGYSVVEVTQESVGDIMTFSFDPTEQLGVNPGDVIHIAIRLTTDGFQQMFPLENVRYDRLQLLRRSLMMLIPQVLLVLLAVAVSGYPIMFVLRRNRARKRTRQRELSVREFERKRVLADRDRKVAKEAMDLLFPSPNDFVRPGYHVAHHRTLSLSRIGDFYNWFQRRDGTLGVYCVDVEGHGLGASDIARSVYQLVDELNDDLDENDRRGDRGWGNARAWELLEEIDRRAMRTSTLRKDQRGFTINFTEIDPMRSQVRYANAGMPAPLLFRYDESQPEQLRAAGVYIGEGYSRYAVQPNRMITSIAPGDILVIASDGILEARDPHLKLFGYSGLTAAVIGARKQSPSSIVNAIMTAVQTHSKRQEPDDDQTLIVVKIVDEGEGFLFDLLETPSPLKIAYSILRPKLCHWAQEQNYSAHRSTQIWQATWEAIQNAVMYGRKSDQRIRVRVAYSRIKNAIEVELCQPSKWSAWKEDLRSAREEVSSEPDIAGGIIIMMTLSNALDVHDDGSRISLHFRRSNVGTSNASSTESARV